MPVKTFQVRSDNPSYDHQLMLRLHLFEWLGCSFMFVNKITILNENCVRVLRWTKKSGNKVNSID